MCWLTFNLRLILLVRCHSCALCHFDFTHHHLDVLLPVPFDGSVTVFGLHFGLVLSHAPQVIVEFRISASFGHRHLMWIPELSECRLYVVFMNAK